MVCKGIVGSEGMIIGKAHLKQDQEIEIDMSLISQGDVAHELAKVKKAIKESKDQLSQIKEKTLNELGQENAMIFDAHMMILEDPELIRAIEDKIQNDLVYALYAVKKTVDDYAGMLEAIDDEYMQERAGDIKDIGGRILRNIGQIKLDEISGLSSPVIVIANDLTPSDTAAMDKSLVIGFATDIGGRTSHTAIMARSLEIPAIIGLGDISKKVKDGDTLILDGLEGQVIINPNEETIKEYKLKMSAYQAYKKQIKDVADQPALTTDGRKIEILGNIGSLADVAGLLENKGEGVGLFRTEFLYMDRQSLPSEEEQYLAYKRVAKKLGKRPVIIRTLDIGGDKKLPYLPLADEMNPFLGYRAIRICLDQKDLFKTQLRAILRASSQGNILIMYPMISGIGEVRQANLILDEVKSELRLQNIDFNEDIKVGVMIEIPSAALTADIIIKEVDFFSIGTNDLCQYTMAIDRMNPKVSSLYQPLHPAILRLIKNVVEASHKDEKFTGMCGEMAGDVESAVILLGLGLDEFSMSPSSIPRIKSIIRKISYEKAKEIADHALSLETPEEVGSYSRGILKELGVEYI